MTANSNPGQIVRWEILKGLPGEGPIPGHFHTGHPTPWAEGFVVRFWNEDGTDWVGNFQGRGFGRANVSLWPEANAISTIAGGSYYLIDSGNPDSYSTLGPQSVVGDMGFDEHRQMLFVAEGYRVHAYDVQRRKLWSKGPGGYATKIAKCVGGVLTVEIEQEIAGPTETVTISTAEESVDDRRYLDILFSILETRPEVERLDPGLSDTEVHALQHRFKFWFPPDLRGLLQFKVPVGQRFPHWRGDPDDLQKRFDLPFEGICFDVEHNEFWLPEWGTMPSDPQARREVVRQAIFVVPKLVPVFSHRYVPNVPHGNGNPVFSVHQTDIIYYGNDLADYFHREFRVPLPSWAARTPRPIRFWNEALKWRDE